MKLELLDVYLNASGLVLSGASVNWHVTAFLYLWRCTSTHTVCAFCYLLVYSSVICVGLKHHFTAHWSPSHSSSKRAWQMDHCIRECLNLMELPGKLSFACLERQNRKSDFSVFTETHWHLKLPQNNTDFPYFVVWLHVIALRVFKEQNASLWEFKHWWRLRQLQAFHQNDTIWLRWVITAKKKQIKQLISL